MAGVSEPTSADVALGGDDLMPRDEDNGTPPKPVRSADDLL